MNPTPSSAGSSDPRVPGREIFRELIEIDTTHATGSTTDAAEAMRRRLLDAGMPERDVAVLGPCAGKGNLVARLRGSGSHRPILLLAHLDVVEARASEWSVNPFELTERDGHFYGRGTTDDKAMAAIWVANLIRYVQIGFQPDRDIIVALTADEEGGDFNGAEWLLREHPDLVDAEFGLNEGGYGRSRGTRRIANVVQAGEKTYLDLELLAEAPGGHSSIPLPESAITILAGAVARLSRHRFPVRLSEVTRGFFARMAEIEEGEIASDMLAILRSPPDADAVDRLSAIPYYNGLLRNTAAVTRLQAGEENNTVPSLARAVVNCRLLPGESAAALERDIAAIIDDDRVRIRALSPSHESPPSPLNDEIMGPVERITADLWPGVPVLPVMGIGGTDSRHFRQAGIPMYGVSGIFLDVDDVRAHAPDERLGVEAFYEGQEFLFRLVRQLTQSTAVSDGGREV
jgi:acetylornithine deacetylase/succinyl-diaminopimelate desuccinylase-like protein